MITLAYPVTKSTAVTWDYFIMDSFAYCFIINQVILSDNIIKWYKLQFIILHDKDKWQTLSWGSLILSWIKAYKFIFTLHVCTRC